MGKTVKIFLVIVTVLVLVYIGSYLANSGTLYEGYVEIETISISEIINELETNGCRTDNYRGKRGTRCLYEINHSKPDDKGIIIYPYGHTYNPTSIYIRQNKLSAVKDLSGFPNSNKYKEVVRENVKIIGGFLTIKENTWKITKVKYPWIVLY